MEHTKGPWKMEGPFTLKLSQEIEERVYTVGERTLYNRDGHAYQVDMCNVFCWNGEEPDDEARANARLISAAPELLDACHLARGEINQILDAGAGNDAVRIVLRKITAAIAKAEGREE